MASRAADGVFFGAAGQGLQAVDIDATGATMTIRLPGGAYAGECATWDELRAKDALRKR